MWIGSAMIRPILANAKLAAQLAKEANPPAFF
jgi:hypothetical protein